MTTRSGAPFHGVSGEASVASPASGQALAAAAAFSCARAAVETHAMAVSSDADAATIWRAEITRAPGVCPTAVMQYRHSSDESKALTEKWQNLSSDDRRRAPDWPDFHGFAGCCG
jgi:hypothetical protein